MAWAADPSPLYSLLVPTVHSQQPAHGVDGVRVFQAAQVAARLCRAPLHKSSSRHARACRRWKSDCSDIRRRHLCRCIVGHQVRACACCTSASESCCDLSAGSLVPDGNSENVAVLLQEVQGSIPKLKQASDARSLCPFSLSL